MSEYDRPLFLVVCDEPGLGPRVRAALRAEGVLSSPGASVRSALRLLSQVRVDGCVIACRVTPVEAEQLRRALEHVSPGCPKLAIAGCVPASAAGWETHPDEGIGAAAVIAAGSDRQPAG